MHLKTAICLAAALALSAPPAWAGGSGSTAQRHQVHMYEVERLVDLDATDYADGVQVGCLNGDLALNGSWVVNRVDHNPQLDDPAPDGGEWNTYNGVDVTESQSTADPSTWSFSVSNNSDEAAQVHVFITCIDRLVQPAEGDSHRHLVRLGAKQTASAVVPAGSVETIRAGGARCDGRSVAVAAGFYVPRGAIKLWRSAPGRGLRTWQLGVYAPGDPEVRTSIRCLQIDTGPGGAHGHTHPLKVAERSRDHELAPGQIDQPNPSCGEQEKGMHDVFDVRPDDGWGAAYDEHRLWFLGDQPQIKTRAFFIQNTSEDTSYTARLGALCFNDRVGRRQL